MVRIFNNNGFAYGGRMFGWHQQIPKPARRTMTINEELIAEADFAAMHISILYSRAGLMLDGDAYDVDADYNAGDPELTRKHVKRAVNTMLSGVAAQDGAGNSTSASPQTLRSRRAAACPYRSALLHRRRHGDDGDRVRHHNRSGP
jgi:hypothetical protein